MSRSRLLIGSVIALALAAGGAYLVERRHQAEHRRVLDRPARHLQRMVYGARLYFETVHVRPDGTIWPAQLPGSVALTPDGPLCVAGEPWAAPDPAAWAHPSWVALQFRIDDPHPYRYAFVSDGRSFTARALGDLDCDGIFSTFELAGSVDAEGEWRVAPLFRALEAE